MSRTERLLALLQLLRRYRKPVKAQVLAEKLQVSVRTLYRDIATLQGQGAPILGEAGIGYVLRAGYTLPPLMFGHEELQALLLGLRWSTQHGDADLAEAARNAAAKIRAVLPADLQFAYEHMPLLIGPAWAAPEDTAQQKQQVAILRHAIHRQCKLDLVYGDVNNTRSQRTVWPVALGYFQQVTVLIAWCELRQAFRHFRVDRMAQIVETPERYPHTRQSLLAQWRAANGIEAADSI